MNNKINKSHLIVIVAVLCFVISGCSGGGTYVGEYKDDLFHGQGTYTYANGDQYVGEFKDGLRHGQGTATSAIGDRYVGECKDDLFHGQGTMTYALGEQLEGVWEEGKFLYENKGK